ncbi:TPA: thioredoxin family protein [Streptococcus suis]|uniref:thioredoxin family protein n=1 Tax=Streptococcus suis TaxID=1307 RepID=UPI001ABE2DF2|nr:thioredoxin family protein [Streptococcus suis]MBO4108834.1 thioredoxin family protein [Streptococcus suis]HEM3641201.1 thioredoxin family protein [Streptococcus suis]
MIDCLQLGTWKRWSVTLGALAILFFAGVGVRTVWDKFIVKDYDGHLTEEVYVDTLVNKNVNLVFYRPGCSLCKAGKREVVSIAEESPYPTFYIDVESKDGQFLAQTYQVEKAATIVQIRDGLVNEFSYAGKTSTGAIEVKTTQIKEALDD